MKTIAPKEQWLSVMVTYKQGSKKTENYDKPLHHTYKTEVVTG